MPDAEWWVPKSRPPSKSCPCCTVPHPSSFTVMQMKAQVLRRSLSIDCKQMRSKASKVGPGLQHTCGSFLCAANRTGCLGFFHIQQSRTIMNLLAALTELNFSIQQVKIWLMILAYISESKVWSSHRMTRKTTHTGVLPSHILGESPRGILCIKDDPKNFDVKPMLNSIWIQPNAICKRVQAEPHTVLNSTGPSHGSTPPTRRATWFCEFEVH